MPVHNIQVSGYMYSDSLRVFVIRWLPRNYNDVVAPFHTEAHNIITYNVKMYSLMRFLLSLLLLSI